MASPKREFDDDFLCFSPTLAAVEEDVFGPAPILGIYADVNMRELAVQEMPPSFCVNPADVMGCCSEESTPEPDCKPLLDDHVLLSTGDSTPAGISRSPTQSPVERQLSHTPGLTADFTDDSSAKSDYTDDMSSKSDFPEDAISAIVSVLKSSVKQEQQEPAMSNLGNDIGIHHPSLAFNPCSSRTAFPGPRIPFGDLQQQNIQPIQVPQFSAYQSFPLPIGFSAPAKPLSLPPASPVLNAHTGIELEELRQRAAETRMRHPNAELDKSFLQCFAGRLSERGELLDEYRCYVIGCGQRNKRRDHILVHVGSHVEHRPWQCQSCGMRFLRKNECKRHESSHEGRKPFSCQICAPYQERNFVRQDLLKRHMRVTHGVNDTSRATASSRKREQARQNEMEGWP
ncbi:hypothetical protein C2E23DRAFT_728140 [Lenzites betulinus]|nr:hypothetical protein C2E23DRAFT_728140 [Lenzites betulinus]